MYALNQLNYHHLYYFYIVAREGSIIKASKILHLTPQTVSGQLTAFENYLGKQLFDRKGKRLVLNETGKITLSYAEDIFNLGSELQNTLSNINTSQKVTFAVGVVDVIPKILSFDLMKPCLDLEEPIHLISREGDFDNLLASLALNKLDLIISDRPLTPGTPIKAYNHLLGETGLTFFATKDKAKQLRNNFPKSLSGEPLLISGDKSNQKINLMSWLNEIQIRPNVVAEFDDSALLKYFGQAGYGIFCIPSINETHINNQYGAEIIGRTTGVKERFYAISPERKIKHPAVKHLVAAAAKMFN